jgi:hypothetical protein
LWGRLRDDLAEVLKAAERSETAADKRSPKG